MNAVSSAQRAFLGNLSLGLTPRIIDVGANVGEWALAALDRWPQANITCVEPQPTAFEALKKAAGGRFNLIQAALVGDYSEIGIDWRKTMWVDTDKDVLASFHRPGTFIPGAVQGKTEIRVDCRTLYELDLGTIDLLKIDTEGHELNVLTGADTRLTPDTIRVIEWEYNQCAIAAHVFVHDFWCLLTGAGYQVGVLRDDGLVEPIREYDMTLEHVCPAREFVAASTITDDGKVVAA